VDLSTSTLSFFITITGICTCRQRHRAHTTNLMPKTLAFDLLHATRLCTAIEQSNKSTHLPQRLFDCVRLIRPCLPHSHAPLSLSCLSREDDKPQLSPCHPHAVINYSHYPYIGRQNLIFTSYCTNKILKTTVINLHE
jgi:hypothetical protein